MGEGLKFIALVVASGFIAVFRPGAETEPAEVVAASLGFFADHMITPLIFFDGLSAFGTGLSVEFDPSEILAIAIDFFVPLFVFFAGAGS